MPSYWLHHIHSISEDPLKVAEFWENLLGAERVGITKPPDPLPGSADVNVNIDLNGTGIKVRVPRTPPLVPGAPVHSGLEHIALRTDDIHAAVAELKASGVKFLEELRELPARSPGAGRIYLCYFLAPGDVIVELLGFEEA